MLRKDSKKNISKYDHACVFTKIHIDRNFKMK